MRVRPLRPVHGVGLHLHPGEGAVLAGGAGGREVLGQGIAVPIPLAAPAGAFRIADRPPRAGGDVHELQPRVRPRGIAKHLRAVPAAGDVPGVERGDLGHLPPGQMEALQGVRPARHDQLVAVAEERLVQQEFVVSVLVQAGIIGAVRADGPHAGRGILRVFDQRVVARMELWVDDRPLQFQDDLPAARHLGDGQAVEAVALQRAHHFAAVGAQAALAQAGAGEFGQRPRLPGGKADCPHFAGSRVVQLLAVGRERPGEAVDALLVRHLAQFAGRETARPELRRAAAVGAEDELRLVRRQGRREEVQVVVDALVTGELPDASARALVPQLPRFSRGRRLHSI